MEIWAALPEGVLHAGLASQALSEAHTRVCRRPASASLQLQVEAAHRPRPAQLHSEPGGKCLKSNSQQEYLISLRGLGFLRSSP